MNKNVNRKARVYIRFVYINFQVSCVIVEGVDKLRGLFEWSTLFSVPWLEAT